MIRLLLNDESRNHGQLLRSWLSGCDEGFAAVAFLKSSGLNRITTELEAFMERGGSLRMVVGTDFHLTEPEALRFLLGLGSRYPKFEWRMVEQSPTSTFHPKYYRFSGGGQIWILTGSANLTSGGLAGNLEASAIAEEACGGNLSMESARLEEALWTNERCKEPTEALIGAYAVGFELNRKRIAEAVDAVKKELAAMPKLDEGILQEELKAYRENADHQKDLILRRENYKEARRLISEDLLEVENLSAADFHRVYESLVGSRGGVKLWHSGGVYRSKAKVLAQWEKAMAMLRELAEKPDRTPEEMYEVGLRWMEEINGLGPNIFTEFCNTLNPQRFAALNNNPVTSIEALHLDHFSHPSSFKPVDYGRFCRCLDSLAKRCGFSDLGETDHFLNFVYWRHKKPGQDASVENDSADN